MLGKLIKYDLKVNLKLYLGMAAVLLATAVGTQLTYMEWKEEFEAVTIISNLIYALMSIAFWITLIVMNVACVVLVIRRFYKHLFGSEGYLTFTLPVSAEQHFFSKVISAVVIYAGCVLVDVVSMFIYYGGIFSDAEFTAEFGYYIEWFGDVMAVGEVIAMAVIQVFSMFSALLMVYFAICVGQMMRRHRVLSAIVIYFGLNSVISTINSMVKGIFLEMRESIMDFQISYGAGYYVIVGVFLAIQIIGFSFGSIRIMKKRLNLE